MKPFQNPEYYELQFKRRTLTVRLSRDLYAALRRAARRDRTSLPRWVRRRLAEAAHDGR